MWNKYLVEFLGAIFFVYVILATGNPLAIGAALALVILLTSNISGGHINPAVSITMAAAGKLPSTEIVPYCISQILGGLVALELYKRVRM
uniref:Major intrinsic protein n=1 Tax=viral metagenome TaxID=1070528 RepID=A0A6C0KGH0_9ZZZZ